MESQQLPTEEFDCPQRYVSEAIGDTYKAWNRFSPVFIEAPTGSGKNTFVLNELAGYAKTQGKCILLISNRTALSQQQKQKLHKKYYSLPISRDDLQEEHLFGNIFLFSYQEISSWLLNLSQYNIGYVVFDEVHFFLSDARFNAYTDIILYRLLNTFSGAIRIYMTATAKYIQDYIALNESKLLSAMISTTVGGLSSMLHGTPPHLIHYRLHPTFENTHFRFFKTWTVIADLIANTPENEKWLIFVQSEDEKNELQKLLFKKDKAKYISSSNKADNESYDEIVRFERFSTRILISTIVLDNGLNLCDPSLKHIAIHSYDPVSTVQAAGRKRQDGSETIYYIKNVTSSEIQQFTRSTNQLIDICDSFQKDPHAFYENHWGKITEAMQKLFRVYSWPNNTEINQFAILKLHLDKAILEELDDSIKMDPDSGFQKQVLSWFQYHELFDAKSMQLEESPSYKEALHSDIESLISAFIQEGKGMDLNICLSFQKKLAEIYQKAVGRKMPTAKDSTRIVSCIKHGLKALEVEYSIEKIKLSDPDYIKDCDLWRFIKK